MHTAFLTCLKCQYQRSGHQDEIGHRLELQNTQAIKQVINFQGSVEHNGLVFIDHLPALEVGSLPLLSTRPERMSEKAQFCGEETQGRKRYMRRGERERGGGGVGK